MWNIYTIVHSTRATTGAEALENLSVSESRLILCKPHTSLTFLALTCSLPLKFTQVLLSFGTLHFPLLLPLPSQTDLSNRMAHRTFKNLVIFIYPSVQAQRRTYEFLGKSTNKQPKYRAFPW